MSDKPLLKPVDFKVTDQDGTERTFILSSFDAVTGRRIITQYPMSGLPKIGDYELNEKLMLEMMSFVAVRLSDGTVQRLSTEALINNFCADFETLVKVEYAMMEKNCSFFAQGGVSGLLENFVQLVTQKLLSISTHLSEQSLPQEKQPFTN